MLALETVRVLSVTSNRLGDAVLFTGLLDHLIRTHPDSNDSGLMHLAAAAGAPTLGLFGPTSIEQYRPRGPLTDTARSATGHMADLDVPTVAVAASALLRRAHPDGLA